ncbi:MAG: cell division protein FtsH, partial [Deltaproteobacteria bacterium CG_4_8_14_3_um_filter_43_13]
LGGRAAEEIVLGDLTTGSGNDLERSTDLVRKMVCEWGMSEDLGPLTFGKKEEQIFLGREIAQHRDYSEDTAIKIDKEVRRIVTENYQRAKKILTENITTLHDIANALLEKEVLDASEINDIVEKGKVQIETAEVKEVKKTRKATETTEIKKVKRTKQKLLVPES